ncbi:hypothetical protein EJ04DRAFT_244784 [Polyplosphaeria fusca]|uniref:Uncharacterized protein n=1 Tax=Polyplosphaeria fusca TaxID=682080 RepID=A0A9P4QXX1_9PLEO|nr:hypothetical protein EJ04DRAFT_244784 [Polyplosphaeria fusca]
MPPKKEKLSDERLHDLIQEYNISFEGPVPPIEWPLAYSHHFHVIRSIWAQRHDSHVGKIATLGSIQRNKARKLREKAKSLAKAIKINESTWRQCEDRVVARFNRHTICHTCGGEKWCPDFEARILDVHSNDILQKKRSTRHMCEQQCRKTKFIDDNDECEDVFNEASEQVVSHEPDDLLRLGNLSIPMKTDRVIGLKCTQKLNQYISRLSSEYSHAPIVGRQELLYPFLVIEAKSGRNSPGCRSIERQTAFAIRRLLMVQYRLFQDDMVLSGKDEPPLVWFFGFQGEEWRLYAGTLEENRGKKGLRRFKVRIYDLWHGTIESQDGALQIYQIVDYIWSWARDIFRPRVQRILSQLCNLRGGVSSASPDRVRQQYSLDLSEQDLDVPDAPESIETIREDSPNDIISAVQEDQDKMEVEQEYLGFAHSSDANFHPFLHWSRLGVTSPAGTSQCSIRFSDLVSFSCHVFEENNQNRLESECRSIQPHFDSQGLDHLRTYAIMLSKRELEELSTLWTSNTAPNSNHTQIQKVTLFFQASCHRQDWQIRRQLFCIVWNEQTPLQAHARNHVADWPATRHPPDRFSKVKKAIKDLHSMRTIQSVLYALGSQMLVFVPRAKHHLQQEGIHTGCVWARPETQLIPISTLQACVNAITNNHFQQTGRGLGFGGTPERLLEIHASADESGTGGLTVPVLPNPFDKGDGILAIRSEKWPRGCPKFCLFVLQAHYFEDKRKMASLLNITQKEKRSASDGTARLDDADRARLKSWWNTLRE